MVNKAIIIGRLGQDPEVRYTQSGAQVTTFSVATNRQWKGQDGQMQDETEWHRIVAWRRLAEICGEYLHKGSMVYIEGRLQTRKWKDQNGNDRYTTEIVALEMKMLSPKGSSGDSYGGGSGDAYGGGGYSEPPYPEGGGAGGGSTGEDVPF